MIVAMSQSGSALSLVLQLLQLLVIVYCVAAELPVCGPPRVPAYGGCHGIAHLVITSMIQIQLQCIMVSRLHGVSSLGRD